MFLFISNKWTFRTEKKNLLSIVRCLYKNPSNFVQKINTFVNVKKNFNHRIKHSKCAIGTNNQLAKKKRIVLFSHVLYIEGSKSIVGCRLAYKTPLNRASIYQCSMPIWCYIPCAFRNHKKYVEKRNLRIFCWAKSASCIYDSVYRL